MQQLRKYRSDQQTRDKYADVKLRISDFIYPYFVVDGESIKKEILSLEGVYHFSIDQLLIDIKETYALGIDKILLFGVIETHLKDEAASKAYEDNNLVFRAVKEIKRYFPQITVITDVCICGYTLSGHCGLIKGDEILNDETLPILAKMALSHAQAGADIVAPSAMMDGQVKAIRDVLDEAGYQQVEVMSYSVKYASNMYGPFRGAVDSAPVFGDRKTYQMDFRNTSQILEEIDSDINEGAAYLMVKPGHTYLDVIYRIKETYPDQRLAAYHVSGEYMMVKAAANVGFLDEKLAMEEVIYAFKRAGADLIISYWAKEFANSVNG